MWSALLWRNVGFGGLCLGPKTGPEKIDFETQKKDARRVR
jgi:hypothetical protein